jgi:membrane protease YdiL (CAAX protease family)
VFPVLAVWALVGQAVLHRLPRSLGALLQVSAGLLGALGNLFVMGTGFAAAFVNGFGLGWLGGVARATAWPLTRLVSASFSDGSGAQVFAQLGGHALEAALELGAGVLLLQPLSEHVFLGRAGRIGVRKRVYPHAAPARASLPRGIVGREWLRLRRTPALWLGAFLFPATMFGLVLLMNTAGEGQIFHSPALLSSAAFSCGAALLCPMLLGITGSEGTALWVLYTVPQSLPRLLMKKASFWLPWAAVSSLFVFIYGGRRAGLSVRDLVLPGSFAAFGLVLYGLLASALGATATDPTHPESSTQRQLARLRQSAFLLCVYAYGLGVAEPWREFGLLILYAAVTAAFWQDAERELEYLLDPVARPTARLALSDGLLATLAFFVLQAALQTFLSQFTLSGWASLVLAFALAGTVVVTGALLVLRKRKLTGLLVELRLAVPHSSGPMLRHGLLWSLPALGLGAGWSTLMQHWPWLSEAARTHGASWPALSSVSDRSWLVALALVAAPACEEILFRGLLLRGLRKSWSSRSSVLLCAGIFAVVHPASAALPVFMMGLCAGLAVERSGALGSAMLVHAVYNGSCLLFAAS